MKGLRFAKALSAAGYHLEVATGFPNYPTGRIAPGYRLKAYQHEVMEGVRVHRLCLWPSHDGSSLGRTANYLSFFLSALIFCLLRARRFDVIYVYHPPITVGLAAALSGFLTRRPFVLDIQDLWPDSVGASGMAGSGRLAKILRPLCDFVHRRAALVIGQSRGMTELLIERGVPRRKTATVFNWADEEAARPGGRYDVRSLEFEGRFNLVFGGNLGRVQGLETLVRAAQRAAQEVPEIQLTLIGEGVERDRIAALIDDLGADNVKLRPGVPQNQIGDVFAASDVLVMHLLDDPLFDITIPSKTQFYMAMGKPILIGVRGEASEMVTEAGAGISVAPEDVEAMAQAMIGLARRPASEREAMGRRARDAYVLRYSFESAIAQTAARMGDVLGTKADGSGSPTRRLSDQPERTKTNHPHPGRRSKRVFDMAVSLSALLFLAPVLGLVALMVRLRLGAPVLFRQTRPGLGGVPFEMIKFRTMRDATGPDGRLLPDAERLTPIGRWLRATSLDELPELWNVLKGDMSLVGPRPLLMEYLPLYSSEQARRQEVRPGITGWAQVNGRNAIGWEEKLELDVWYVDRHNLWLDLKIIALTLLRIIRRDGISAPGSATIEKFRG